MKNEIETSPDCGITDEVYGDYDFESAEYQASLIRNERG